MITLVKFTYKGYKYLFTLSKMATTMTFMMTKQNKIYITISFNVVYNLQNINIIYIYIYININA